MIADPTFSLLAFSCDHEGALLSVERDDEGILGPSAVGSLLPALVARSSMGEALSFITDLNDSREALVRKLDLVGLRGLRSFQFTGSPWSGGSYILVGLSAPEGKPPALDEGLVSLASEQTSELRQARKEAAALRSRISEILSDSEASGGSQTLFAEFSKVNNSLVDARRTLEKQKAELESLQKMRTRFLGIATHDLRSPLAAILGHCELLLEDSALSTNDAESLHAIEISAQRMRILVDDLLLTTSLEQERFQLELSKADLGELLGECIRSLVPIAASKGIGLEGKAAPGLLAIVDRRRVAQAIDNLLANAIKFSVEGGGIEASVTSDGDEACFEILDHGVGIPEARMRTIFSPFGAMSTRGTSGEGGTGLGLYISKRIVESHGGRFELASIEGSGTTIRFSLPRSGPPE
jgi:signal transduction histidine kinase